MGVLDRLVNLSFKTTDQGTAFFKFGAASKGTPVTKGEEAQLKEYIRTFYIFLFIWIVIGSFVSPILGVLTLPAIIFNWVISTNSITLKRCTDHTRLSYTENINNVSAACPSSIKWLLFVCSAVMTLASVISLIADAIKGDDDTMVLWSYFGVVFFSFCVSASLLLLQLSRKHVAMTVEDATAIRADAQRYPNDRGSEIDFLERLKKLLDDGVLTPEEFQAAKSKLLRL